MAALTLRQLLPAIAGVYITQTVLTALGMQAMPTLLREAGASLQLAGMSSIFMLAWVFKFLWAPVIERWRLPSGTLKRRSRQLILAGQCLLALLFVALSIWAGLPGFSLQSHGMWLLVGLVLASLITASVDTAGDGFVIDQLSSRQRGWGNAVQVGGSYFGALLGGSGFLLVVNYWGLSWGLLAVGIAFVVLSLPLLPVHEPARGDTAAATHRPSLRHALRRPRVRAGILVALLINAGVYISLTMLGPMFIDHGASMEHVGWLFGTLSIGAGLAGTLAGGVLVRLAPGWRAVWIALAAQALAQAVLAIALYQGAATLDLLAWLAGVHFFLMACGFVAGYSALMGLTSPLQAGVDFTLFQCAQACMGGLGGVLGGWLSQHWGFAACFGVAAALCAVAGLTIFLRADLSPGLKLND
ncbi:MFS transporter [Pollutimonas bauzanensis]|nr:MFS transporter [Pollutimonas bauzanensis]